MALIFQQVHSLRIINTGGEETVVLLAPKYELRGHISDLLYTALNSNEGYYIIYRKFNEGEVVQEKEVEYFRHYDEAKRFFNNIRVEVVL